MQRPHSRCRGTLGRDRMAGAGQGDPMQRPHSRCRGTLVRDHTAGAVGGTLCRDRMAGAGWWGGPCVETARLVRGARAAPAPRSALGPRRVVTGSLRQLQPQTHCVAEVVLHPLGCSCQAGINCGNTLQQPPHHQLTAGWVVSPAHPETLAWWALARRHPSWTALPSQADSRLSLHS